MKETFKRIGIVALVIVGGIAAYYLYENFRARTVPEKLAAIIHDEDRRELTSRLTNYLHDDSLVVRSRAVLAVGHIGNKKAAEALLPMLDDQSQDVASQAAFALGQMQGGKEYAEKLLEAAKLLPGKVAAAAVLSAGRLSDSTMDETLDDIAEFLNNASPEVRAAACYALYFGQGKEQASSLINLLMVEQDTLVQRAALFTLARLGITDADQVYPRFLADADPFVRSLAVRGLASVKTAEASQYLAISLNDADLGVEAEAIAGLAKQGSAEAANYLWRKLPQVYGDKLLAADIGALQTLKSPQAVDVVTNLITLQTTDNVLAAGVKYLAVVQTDRAVDLIDSIVRSKPRPYVRAACAEAYGLTNRPSVVSRVAMLFNDEDPIVRAAAFDVLTKLDSSNLDFYLNQALSDGDYELQVAAIDAIGGFKDKRYLQTYADIMKRGKDIDADVRRSIIEALPQFFDEYGKDSTLVRVLIAGILDKDYVVRQSAARVYQTKMQEDRWAQVPPAETRISEKQIQSAITRYTGKNPRVRVTTTKGDIDIELYFDVAPLTVLNFLQLVKDGFYNGLIFHRVVPNFVIQGGDPHGDGWGGPGYNIRDEYSDKPYVRGAVGIATSGKDTGGSQWFVTLSPQPHLNGRYTLFGQVIDGMDVADQIERGDTIEKIALIESGKK